MAHYLNSSRCRLTAPCPDFDVVVELIAAHAARAVIAGLNLSDRLFIQGISSESPQNL